MDPIWSTWLLPEETSWAAESLLLPAGRDVQTSHQGLAGGRFLPISFGSSE